MRIQAAFKFQKKRGRKQKDLSKDKIDLIKQKWKKYRRGAVAIATELREKHDLRSNVKVHKDFLDNNIRKENENKKGKKKDRV